MLTVCGFPSPKWLGRCPDCRLWNSLVEEAGLREVSNPSQIFLSERPLGGSGSVVVPSMEGTRPILVEIQSLVTRSFLTLPRRTCIGVDTNRVALILAILEKRKGMNFFDKDVFINVAGGVSVSEPAVDLGIAVGAASSSLDRAVDPYMVFVGEVSPTPASRSRTWPSCAMGEVFYNITRRGVMFPGGRLTAGRGGNRLDPVSDPVITVAYGYATDARKSMSSYVANWWNGPHQAKRMKRSRPRLRLNWPTYLSFG